MNKEAILKDIFGDCDYIHLVNRWFYKHEDKSYSITDYILSNCIMNSERHTQLKNEIISASKLV